ncbi:MAG: hypothetical protein HGA85_04070 [Nanoarchaeota archaeon]|nr:hypothetical protein [Nanoarchaeota archaeon]
MTGAQASAVPFPGTVSSPSRSSALPITQPIKMTTALAWLLVAMACVVFWVDLTTLWNGYSYTYLTNIKIWEVTLRLSALVLPMILFKILVNKDIQSALNDYIFEIVLILLLVVSNWDKSSLFHLFLAGVIYFMYKDSVTDPHGFKITLCVLLLVDFFGFPLFKILMNMMGSGLNPVEMSRLTVPIWIWYTMIQGAKYTQSPTFSWGFVFVFVVTFFTLFDGVTLIQTRSEQLNQGMVTTWIKKTQTTIVKIFTPDTYKWLFDPVTVAGGAGTNSQQAPKKLGIEASIISYDATQVGDYITIAYTPGESLERSLLVRVYAPEKDISVNVRCYALDINDQEIEGTITGTMPPYQISANQIVEKAISCQFAGLTPGDYEIHFDTTYDFIAHVEGDFYPMDFDKLDREMSKSRTIDYSQLQADYLNSKGIRVKLPDASGGPVKLNMGTKAVIAPVRTTEPLEFPFILDFQNMQGVAKGKILSVDAMTFYAPEEYELINCLGFKYSEISTDVAYNGKKMKAYSVDPLFLQGLTPSILNEQNKRQYICNFRLDHSDLDIDAEVTQRKLMADVKYTFVNPVKQTITLEEPIPPSTPTTTEVII